MKTAVYLFLLIIIASCQSSITESIAPLDQNSDTSSNFSAINYVKFTPSLIKGIKLDGYDIEDAYQLDSSVVFTAYTNGDLETSSTPTNWGDRLIMMRNGEIQFESKPVGDPYLYEPNFYRNPTNHKVIIICQLGNEESYGGEAFILENGVVKFMGNIEIETPYDTAEINELVDIVQVSEHDHSIYFEFDSDSLIYLPGNEWIHVKNENIHYKYSGDSLELIGL